MRDHRATFPVQRVIGGVGAVSDPKSSLNAMRLSTIPMRMHSSTMKMRPDLFITHFRLRM